MILYSVLIITSLGIICMVVYMIITLIKALNYDRHINKLKKGVKVGDIFYVDAKRSDDKFLIVHGFHMDAVYLYANSCDKKRLVNLSISELVGGAKHLTKDCKLSSEDIECINKLYNYIKK